MAFSSWCVGSAGNNKVILKTSFLAFYGKSIISSVRKQSLLRRIQNPTQKEYNIGIIILL